MNIASASDEHLISQAIERRTKGFKDATSESVAAAIERSNEAVKQAMINSEIRKDEGEIEALKYLFNDDDE